MVGAVNHLEAPPGFVTFALGLSLFFSFFPFFSLMFFVFFFLHGTQIFEVNVFSMNRFAKSKFYLLII